MVFSRIWQADMEDSGLLPLIKGLSDEQKDPEKGYVIVDMDPMSEETTVFKEVVIPAGKKHSYDLFMKLYNNYEWIKKQDDPKLSQEDKELGDFLRFAAESAPMRLARKYAEDYHHIQAGCPFEDWVETLRSIWFKPLSGGSTFFENVFIGEAGGKAGTLGRHLFWYLYHINAGRYQMLKNEDSSAHIKHVEVGGSEESPLAEVITIKYTLEETDRNGSKKSFSSEVDGIFVGTSAEGLMALGTVAYLDGHERITIEINGKTVELNVLRTGDDSQNPRSFYPKIKSPILA